MSSGPVASPPMSPFLLLGKRRRSRHAQNYIWIYRSNCSAYQRVNHTHSTPTAVQLQNQSSVKTRDFRTESSNCLLLLQTFTAFSLFSLLAGGISFFFLWGRAFSVNTSSLPQAVQLQCGRPAFLRVPCSSNPSLHILVKACRDFMALGQPGWGLPPTPCHGPNGCSSCQGVCPALPYSRFPQWTSRFQPALGACHPHKPWAQCWRVQLQACLQLDAGYGRIGTEVCHLPHTPGDSTHL